MDPLDLNIDLNGVDTSAPCLVAGEYAFHIGDIKVEPKKDEPTKRNLVVKFVLAQPANSSAGHSISPGFPISKYYPLQQSENPKAPDFKRDLSILLDAVFATNESTRPKLNGETLAEMLGRTVVAVVSVTNSEAYGAQNNIVRIKPTA